MTGHTRHPKWPWVVLGVLILLAGGCVALFLGIREDASKEVTVTYEVTGSASDVAVSYSTWRRGEILENRQTSQSLPWRKEVTTTAFSKGGVLAATTGASGGSVTCRVSVGGGKPRTATASGPFATATCSGF
ncbi:MmpS family transport accessory protein [Streptomyces sp. NPDC053048]|uniref:MmpS family transport accessory protein n=1 Tax=Streptomyces sp. NPDC053048 TaxID=3365694 RepID=UPI0037D1B8E8